MNEQEENNQLVSLTQDYQGTEKSWVLFEVRERIYALRTEHVAEMVILGDWDKLPESPPHIRGVINLRGRVIPVADLRVRLGMKSRLEEFEELRETLHAREQDHIHWLQELKDAVHEGREFTLTTDPHACAFGKWYDTYEAPNRQIDVLLKKLDEPHKRIHALGDEACQLVARDEKEEATELIDEIGVRTLNRMQELFEDLRTMIDESMKEVVIVVNVEEDVSGIIVDRVREVRDIDDDSISTEGMGELRLAKRFVHGVAKVDDQLAILLDTAKVLGLEEE